MKTTFNAKTDTYTISGITAEQIEVICYLVNNMQTLTAQQRIQEIVKKHGKVMFAELNNIEMTESDIDILHTIDI